jgi:amino acid adenylation domain-containing protein
VQVISPEGSFELRIIDLRELGPEDRKTEIDAVIRNETVRRFDLTRGPLMFCTLIIESDSEHVLVLCLHHIVFDGWSVGVFIREFAALYNAFCEGKSSPLPKLPIQYADYAVWQRSWPDEANKRQLEYWRNQLGEKTAVLTLPTDRHRPAVQSFQGDQVIFTVGSEILEKLSALGKQEGATLFMVLAAAFKMLLHRYSGSESIPIGTPIANRNRAEIEDLIGFFLNTLVLNTDLSGNPTFRELLLRVREVTLGAYAHQDIPFEMLLEELHPARTTSHTPLFQVMFVLQNAPVRTYELSGITLHPIEFENSTAKFDLNLHMAVMDGTIRGALFFNTDIFDRSTGEWIVGHFQALLGEIAENPDRKILSYPLLTDEEKMAMAARRHHVQITASYEEFDRIDIEQSVAARFEKQAARHSSNLAVKTRDEEYSYDALNRAANRTAHVLLNRCADVERIALLFEQSPAMLVAMLGVLKTGKVYIPLDPDYPKSRLEYMLADSGAGAIVTSHTNRELASALSGGTIDMVIIDDIDPEIPSENPDISVPPDALAYILYTSGSTGEPKGVMQNNRNILHFIREYANNLHISSGDRLSLLSSYSFDASVMDIFGALLNGAALYPVNLKRDNIDGLADWFRTQGITIYHSTPTVYRLFTGLAGGEPGNAFPQIRLVVLGGEEVYKRDAELFRRYFSPKCILVNGLGPTESTVSLQQFIDASTPLSRTSIPVGYPVEETEVYLAGPNGENTEAFGEIAIKSRYIALGYWNKPALTEKVFLADPAGDGRRIYLTGDMGRLLPDGAIEFAGRKDNQVKIRGYRIETGEVENHLFEYPGISKAAVVAGDSTAGERRLIAYIETDKRGRERDVRSFLKERLPDYMIPSVIICVDSFPLTPTGKIDRRKLSEQKVEIESDEDNVVAPQNQTQEILTGIWKKILGHNGIGVHDNFFELGGHSLLATQIVSLIRDSFNVEVPLREIFEKPTIQQLSESIESYLRSELEYTPAPIEPAPRDQDLPLSYSQYRMWFIQQLTPESIAYSMPGAIRVKGSLNPEALIRSFELMARRHEILRTVFLAKNGQPIQKPLAEMPLEVHREDLRPLPVTLRMEKAAQILGEDAGRLFILSEGKLFRLYVLHLDENEFVIYTNMHHIVSDQWSGTVMAYEITEAYNAFTEGREPNLPELPIQYADFAFWQRRWLDDRILNRQLSYWTKQLDGITPLDFPVDNVRPRVQQSRGAGIHTDFSPSLVDRLKKLSVAENATLFMTTLACFNVLLYRYTLKDDISLGTPIANRTQSAVEGLIGTFVNTLVMRTDLSGDPPFRELLRRVRATALDAYANQDMPFEKLIEAMHPERDMSHLPLVEVLFNLHNAPARGAFRDDVQIDLFELERGGAQFDLTMTLELERSRRATLVYNTDLFRETTAVQLARHYESLLEQVADNPDQRISEIPLLNHAERRQYLVDWNATRAEYPRNAVYHELFSARARLTPEAVAIVHDGRRMTYRELEIRSNRLAHYLRKVGAGPDTFVGLLVERSTEMVVGLLGILKAGAAYLPLDPLYPPDRVRFTLDDSAAAVLVTQSSLAGDYAEPGRSVVRLDTDAAVIALESDEMPENRTRPADLAYIIYTSGSTGKPKGVIISHRALLNFLCSMSRDPGFTADDVLLSVTTISFDIAGLEIYLPLMAGGRLVIAGSEEVTDGAKLVNLMKTSGATVMQATPSTWRLMLEAGWSPDTPVKILCGGESMPLDLAQKLLDRGTSVWNMYGPTETTIWSTIYRLRSKNDPVLIGRPIANTTMYILDKHRQPVPAGVPGELYIGGEGLALGYWNRPELTAERFIKNPFSDDDEARIYRTGDLARYRPDGNIECLGRIDNQVKVRGHRIELGEIESIINGMPGVKQSVVVVREDTPGDKRITAYLEPSAEKGNMLSVSEIREYVRKSLPEYMAPSFYMIMESLPLTPNGKIDRRMLPRPERETAGLDESYVAPRNERERKMADIWANVLKLERVGIHDNFFDIGGHSMLATELISRINQDLGVSLQLRALFLEPTVAGLMQEIEPHRERNVFPSVSNPDLLIPIQVNGTKPPLFIVAGAHERDEDYLRYLSCLIPSIPRDQPVFGLRPRGLASNEKAFSSVELMAAEYIKIMRQIMPNGPYLIAGECVGGIAAFEIAQQLERQNSAVALLVLLDTHSPNRLFTLSYRIQHLTAYRVLKWIAHVFRTHTLKQLSAKVKARLNGRLSQNKEEQRIRHSDFISYKYRLILFKYKPRDYLKKITFIVNSEYNSVNPTLGWERYAKGEIEMHIVPGNHLTRLTIYGKATGKVLSECIERALEKAGGRSS